MKFKSKLLIAAAFFVVLAMGTSFLLARSPAIDPEMLNLSEDISGGQIKVVQEASYGLVTRENMYKQAQIIFVGEVTNISPSQWNQESGEYWDDEGSDSASFQIHQIDMQVINSIVDTIGLGDRATITVLGNSPLEGNAEHDLRVGDRAIIFAVQTELAWREGNRTVFEFVTVPALSHFVVEGNGNLRLRPPNEPSTPIDISLDQLIQDISQIRGASVQP